MIRVSFLSIFIVAICCTSYVRAQELIIYAMPAPVGYNWESPHTLFISYVENMLKPTRYHGHKHLMGHMLIELKDSTRQTLVGAVPRRISQLRSSIIVEKHGLGTLLTSYTGLLETTEDNQHQLTDRYPHGDIAYIRLLISREMFDRLWQYLDEYRARGYDTIYNGDNKPREGKGAGCSAFAVSFIEVGRLLDSSILAQWQVRVNIQDNLVGGPEKEREISILKMAFTQRWAKENKQAFHPILYYEPTIVYNWIKEKNKQIDSRFLYNTETRQNAPGIVIDCRSHPTPKEDIWERR